jgi:RNA polymerase sigma-70 factor (family 1)
VKPPAEQALLTKKQAKKLPRILVPRPEGRGTGGCGRFKRILLARGMNQTTIDIIQLQRNVAIDRDQKSYQQLFLHYYRPLIRFAITIVGSKEAAEEIYSSVFLKLWDLGNALNNIDHLTVYLYISVKNASLNYLAKYHRVRTVDIDSVNLDFLQGSHCPEDSLLQAELHRHIGKAIKALPAKCQLVYKLIKEDGFSYKQVAEILDISVNTVEGHMTAALKKLAVSLKAFMQPDRN